MAGPNVTQVAALIYDWYRNLGRGEMLDEATYALLEDILQTSMSLEQFRLMGSKLRNSPGFEERRERVLDHWGPVMHTTVDEEAANCFLAELFESFDHSLMFSHTLEAGKTSMRPGQVNDGVTTVGGNMPCWTLHLITRGQALYDGGDEIQLGRGSVLLFSPNASCHYRRHPSSKLWVHEWLLFQPRSHWAQWMDWPEVGAGVQLAQVSDKDSLSVICALSSEIRKLGETSMRLALDLQYNRLEELLIRASASGARPAPERQDARVAGACDFIRENLSRPFTVADVARHCNVSASRMAHLFQHQMGVGIMHWRNDLRMQQARRLLLDSSESVAEIAYRVGYGDPSQFSKYFAKHIGVGPREFRNSLAPAHSKSQQ